MCLVFVGWRAHPRYRLVVAANRDEYHARPTAPAAPWEDESGRAGLARVVPRASGFAPRGLGARTSAAIDAGLGADAARRRILAGRDLQAGGTWLGVSPEGRFAALTNVSGSASPGPGAPSRGRLPVDFIRGTLGAREYARAVSGEADRYSGFNLLLADREVLYCVTNRGGERMTELPPGCHGLGNDCLNAPEPKVTGGLAEFSRLLAMEFEADGLCALLSDDEPAKEASLRSLDLEGSRSSRFIRGQLYGTRSSTVLSIERSGAIAFEERSFDARAAETSRVAFACRPGSALGFQPLAPAARTAAAH